VAGVTESEMLRLGGTEWVGRVAGVTEIEMVRLGGTEWVGRVADVTDSEMVRRAKWVSGRVAIVTDS